MELAVHQHIHIFHQRIIPNILPDIPGVEPDGLIGKLLFNLLHQFSYAQSVRRMERVAPGKGNSRNITLLKLFKNFLPSSLIKQQSAVRVPCNRILAVFTAMIAACHPKHHAKPISVEHIVLGYIMVSHPYILFLSAISAIFASFSLVSPCTRE